MRATGVSDPDGYRLEFESPTTVSEDTKWSELENLGHYPDTNTIGRSLLARHSETQLHSHYALKAYKIEHR
jgi:hypothetical protein